MARFRPQTIRKSLILRNLSLAREDCFHELTELIGKTPAHRTTLLALSPRVLGAFPRARFACIHAECAELNQIWRSAFNQCDRHKAKKRAVSRTGNRLHKRANVRKNQARICAVFALWAVNLAVSATLWLSSFNIGSIGFSKLVSGV